MIYLVASMSRSVSMWTYNVIREILKTNDIAFKPTSPARGTYARYINSVLRKPADQKNYVLKSHMLIDPRKVTTELKVVCPYRDVREALASYKRFMRCDDFDHLLDVVKGMMANMDYYTEKFHIKNCPINYDYIQFAPIETVMKIADYLELPLERQQAKAIVDKFSKDKVERKVQEINEADVPLERFDPKYDVMENFDQSPRLVDRASGFQTNHITNADWKEDFTEEEQKRLNQLCGDWLLKYGFLF